jgi:hypothetical protein
VVTVDDGGSWQERYDKSVADEELRQALEPSSLAKELASDEPRWWLVLIDLRFWITMPFVATCFLMVLTGWLATIVGLQRGVGLAVGGIVGVLAIAAVMRHRVRRRRRALAFVRSRAGSSGNA